MPDGSLQAWGHSLTTQCGCHWSQTPRCPLDCKALGKSPRQARQSCKQSSPTSHLCAAREEFREIRRPSSWYSIWLSKCLLTEWMNDYLNTHMSRFAKHTLASHQSPFTNQSLPVKQSLQVSCFATVSHLGYPEYHLLGLVWSKVLLEIKASHLSQPYFPWMTKNHRD